MSYESKYVGGTVSCSIRLPAKLVKKLDNDANKKGITFTQAVIQKLSGGKL
tara:strand:- start:439 stop:591 length:153 start_codon:yes stop_codon:yes gene_type:complete